MKDEIIVAFWLLVQFPISFSTFFKLLLSLQSDLLVCCAQWCDCLFAALLCPGLHRSDNPRQHFWLYGSAVIWSHTWEESNARLRMKCGRKLPSEFSIISDHCLIKINASSILPCCAISSLLFSSESFRWRHTGGSQWGAGGRNLHLLIGASW